METHQPLRLVRSPNLRAFAGIAALGVLAFAVAWKAAAADPVIHVADIMLLAATGFSLLVAARSDARGRLLDAERVTEISEANEANRVLFEASPVAIQVFDLETLRFVAANDAALELTGYTLEELQRKTVMDTTVTPAPGVPDAIRAFDGGWSGRAKLKRRDGAVLDVEISTRQLCFRGRKSWMVASIDVTAREAAEHRMHEAQKMEALGRLASGVGHEFNDQLSVVLGYACMLLDGRVESDPLVGPLNEMRNAAVRASEVSQRLLAFSRLGETVGQPLDLNDGVRAATGAATAVAGTRCAVEWLLVNEPAVTRISVEQIEQILVNLVGNARDAMPSGGTITIETKISYELATLDAPPERRLSLSVSDSGAGVDAATVAHAFEPFFTTKPQGSGMGLGLSIVYGIVQQCGGNIALTTADGRGTNVTISLPSIAAPRSARPSRAHKEHHATH